MAEFQWDAASIFYGVETDARWGIENTRGDECAGRAGGDAARARSAGLSKWHVRLKFHIDEDCCEQRE